MNFFPMRVIGLVALINTATLTTSCSAMSAQPDNAELQTSAYQSGFTGYEIEWQIDDIVEFRVDLRALGTVKSITKASRELQKNQSYTYTDYEIEIEQSAPELESATFIARQVDLNLRNVGSRHIKVGETVLFLGSLPNPDDFGKTRAVADWMIEIAADGTMDFGNPKQKPKFNDYVEKLKLKKKL